MEGPGTSASMFSALLTHVARPACHEALKAVNEW